MTKWVYGFGGGGAEGSAAAEAVHPLGHAAPETFAP